jgi:hypothetical protein
MKRADNPELKYIIEYDRKGRKDCVFYQCDNRDFVDFVEKFGFKEATGTFSDISVIAPALGVAAVNLASGYYFPHTNHEVVSLHDMHNVVEASVNMMNTECDGFKYIKKKYTYSGYSTRRAIEVTMLPADVARVYDYTIDEKYRNNRSDELAIDEYGNLYKYSEYSKCFYTSCSATVTLFDGYVPTYDPNNVTTIYAY